MKNRRLIGSFLILIAGSVASAQDSALRADVREGKPAVPPQSAQVLSLEARGDISMARKMYREAAETYLEVKPPTAIILNKVGIAYHQMSDLNSAQRYYQRSIKLKPDYSEAINNLGTIYYARKSYRRAISTYKRALKITPDSASILSNLGTGYFARRDYKRAIECYDQALRLDPEVFEHRSTQGVLLQERSVEERAKFHYFLAKTYAKAGRDDLALTYIRKSLEEGFKERAKYMQDDEFKELRKLPEFADLMKLEPRVL
jgi:tetratricopeptide (TPR) repeat protein